MVYQWLAVIAIVVSMASASWASKLTRDWRRECGRLIIQKVELDLREERLVIREKAVADHSCGSQVDPDK